MSHFQQPRLFSPVAKQKYNVTMKAALVVALTIAVLCSNCYGQLSSATVEERVSTLIGQMLNSSTERQSGQRHFADGAISCSPELNQPRLLRVQCQTVFLEPLDFGAESSRPTTLLSTLRHPPVAR